MEQHSPGSVTNTHARQMFHRGRLKYPQTSLFLMQIVSTRGKKHACCCPAVHYKRSDVRPSPPSDVQKRSDFRYWVLLACNSCWYLDLQYLRNTGLHCAFNGYHRSSTRTGLHDLSEAHYAAAHVAPPGNNHAHVLHVFPTKNEPIEKVLKSMYLSG